MSLFELLKNVPASNKTYLLGPETTRLLRYTFANKNDNLDDNILNEALALKCGSDFYNKKELRQLIAAFTPKSTLHELGINNHEELKEIAKNKKKFASKLEIEVEFCLDKPKEERHNIESCVPVYGECNGTKSYPHDYQFLLKNKVINALQNEINPNILLTLPTGAGKTVLAMEVIVDLLRARKFSNTPNILWLVNKKELAEQSLVSFLEYWKQKGDHEVLARRYFGKFNNIDVIPQSSITFATYDLILNRLNDEALAELMQHCEYVFIDEAHYSYAEKYNEVLKFYKNLNKEHRILALTATPFRNDLDEFSGFKKNFKTFLQLSDVIDTGKESPIQYLQKNEYLSNVRTTKIQMRESSMQDEVYYRELHERVLEVCLNTINCNENIIIFAETKSHAIALSIFLSRKKILNGLFVQETHDVHRKKLLNDFKSKKNELNVLINHGILATGIDVPGMNAIMILREIKTPTLALQIIGRAMRGKKNGGNYTNDIYLTQSNFDFLSRFQILENLVLIN